MFRTRHLCSALAALATACLLTACAASKSANPLSPTVAGPIPGVDISAPRTVQPTAGATIFVDQQPVTLMLENASSSGARPLTYSFEIATDADFTNKVFVRDGIAPGDSKTSLRLPDPLATGRAYFWRARAQDGANTGPFSSTMSFNVVTPIVIGQATLLSPSNGLTISDLHPTFRFANATRSGPVGAITYVLELATNDSFANRVAVWTIAEQPNQTTLEAPQDLAYVTQYFWRVRAADPTTVGPFSDVHVFQTPAPPPPPPPPVEPTIPTGPTGPGGWPPAPGTHPPKPPNVVTVDVEEVRLRVRWGLWNWQSNDDESYWMNQIVIAPERGHTPGWVSDDYWYDKIARGDGVGRGYVWPPR